jgi:putative spermidine/putrescine transport system substrate-binding protein
VRLRSSFAGLCVCAIVSAFSTSAWALDGPEIYPGERALEDAANREGLVVVGNLAPGWANWAAVERAFAQRYPGVTLAYNDLGSVATVMALDRMRERPTIDVAYFFGLSAIDAHSRGLLSAYKPAGAERVAAGLRDADGAWTGVHHLPVVFVVNRKLAKILPRSWADLKKPEFKASVTYFDPVTTSIGLITVVAANAANGGTLDSLRPAIDYFTQLHKSGAIQKVETLGAYERFARGEIPVWITFEQDGVRLRQMPWASGAASDDIEIVYPSEGAASAVYAIGLVKGARNEAAGKLFVNFAFSETAQRLFADGFVRPALPGLPVGPETQRLPPNPRVEFVDLLRLSQRKPDIDRAWPRIVAGN